MLTGLRCPANRRLFFGVVGTGQHVPRVLQPRLEFCQDGSRPPCCPFAVLLPAHTALWLLQPSWAWRWSALALTVLLWPVLTVLLFDRRPTR